MWTQFKRVFLIGFGLLQSAACFFGAYLAFQDTSLDTKTAHKYSGLLVKKGLLGKHFAFSFTNNPAYFRVYNIGRNYQSLNTSLTVGDSVTVYYSGQENDQAIDVFQIEDGGRIIVTKSSMEGQNKTAAFMCLVAGSLGLGFAVSRFRKQG